MNLSSAKRAASAAFNGKVDVQAEAAPWDADTLCITVHLQDGRGHTWSGPAGTKAKDVTAFFRAWYDKLV